MCNADASNPKQRRNEALILTACIAFILVFLITSQSTAEKVYNGLLFSAVRIVPAVFPVMLIAEILLRSGALSFILKAMTPIMKKAKRNPAVVIPYLAGIICGFPVGAKYVHDLTEKGMISKYEADCLLAGSNCASPAFAISSVGVGMFSSAKLGVSLWIISTTTSLVLSFFILPEYDREKQPPISYRNKNQSFAEIFCASAKSTSLSLINIISLITFFYTLSETAASVFSHIGATPLLSSLVSAVLEIGSGCNAASFLPQPYSVCLSSFAVGFGGICVYFQVKSEAHDGANMRKYLLIKTVCALISTLFAFFLLQ